MKSDSFRLLLISMLFVFSSTSCGHDPQEVKEEENETPTVELPVSPNNQVIYEVNVRNYSAQGNFAGLEKEIPRLKELGVAILWLMPIHPVGEKNRTGSKGSPYSVKDYLKINPDYGTVNDLKSLISKAHEAKMEIWLDWVANHTAWDHPWVNEHLDYYASKNGQQPYAPNGWNDVAQLNYANQNLRTAMIDAMKYWVNEFDIDGFRCDYVAGVPVDFWQKAKSEIEPIKKITWMAEGDNASYMSVFDCDYAWAFNTSLADFGKNKDLTKLKAACNALFNNANYKDKSRMVYLTNHDLNAYDGTVFVRFGNSVLPLTVLYFTIYDMPLIYNGQEIGASKAMGLFDVNPVPWTPVNSTIQNLFQKLTRLKRSQPALENGKNRGSLHSYHTTSDRIFVFSRKRENNEVLMMLNFANSPVNFKFNSTAPAGSFSNYLTVSEKQEFNTSNTIHLAANGYAIYIK